MRRVILESPAGDLDESIRYLTASIADSLARGEAPFASHGLHMQALNAWRDCAEATVVYVDLGITAGMKHGIDDATHKRQSVEYRQLPGWGGVAR